MEIRAGTPCGWGQDPTGWWSSSRAVRSRQSSRARTCASVSPDRAGSCVAYALLACDRLLRAGASDVTFVLGRVFGLFQQSWCEAQADEDGPWWVADLTLDDERPFPREAYYAAMHATVGTRVPVPDLATLDALRELAEENETLRGSRAAFLERLSAAVSRQE